MYFYTLSFQSKPIHNISCPYRMLEQVPTQMGDGAVRWAKLIFPLVVHSAPKVRLRAAVALEMGMPLLLEKQNEVVAIIEPMMSSVSIVYKLSTSSAPSSLN